MRLDEGNYLAHYGILRKSGRYPWGSGRTPLQRSKTFLDITNDMRKDGMSDAQIAKAFSTEEYPFTTAKLRALRSQATTNKTQDQIRTAQKLKDKGMSSSEIGRQMGINESSVRSLLEPGRLERLDILQQTTNMLKRQVDEKGFVDVGGAVEKALPIGNDPAARIGISPDKFKTALAMLQEEGYNIHPVYIKQLGTGEMTRNKVLCKPGVTKQEAYANRENIKLISERSDDHGRSFNTDFGIQPPLHIDLKRVGIKYKEDGGAEADGVIYVRPGVKDIELGKSSYAQVRIAVGGTHYLKGMAVYKNDLPPGTDLLFNTNKSNTGNKLDALKPLKTNKETGEIDKDNPFGAVIKHGGQILDEHGKVTSAMNKINEEGDWNEWSKTLSRQVLSKQSPDLVKSQLELTYDRRVSEFERLKTLTNPAVKRKLLETFADETDSAAVHLKAVSMPRQATKVLLPSKNVKPNEIYAPTFRHGERVTLVRFPHAGTFELPELTVNNRGREARKQLSPDAPDAVLIHHKVAEHLSGADFDGDHVVVIPNNRGQIRSTPPLEKLKGFDPQHYKVPLGPKTKEFPEGTPSITPTRKQQEMGITTNLIADMTVKGATTDHLARAVRHSMVVIDSEKHNLDFKQSERDHGIAELKRIYQGVHPGGQLKGASTLITRATAEAHPVKRKAAPTGKDYPGRVRIAGGTVDVKTGKKLYVDKGETTVRFKDPSTGKKVTKTFRDRDLADTFVKEHVPGGKAIVEAARFKSKQLVETDDAFSLVSEGKGHVTEQHYAEHSNRLKSLANDARRELVNTKTTPYNQSSARVYAHEVASLNASLEIAQKNAPLERHAQRLANTLLGQKKRANPEMGKDEERKIKGQLLDEARLRTGAKKHPVPISDREWDAIQAGAISNDKLKHILQNTDVEEIRRRATPRENPVMTSVMTTRAKSMLASGYTPSEIADALDIPISTLESSVAQWKK